MSSMVGKIASTLYELTESLPETAIQSFKDTFTTLSIIETTVTSLEKNVDLFYEGVRSLL